MKSILFTFTILFFVTACQKEKPNLEEPDIQSLRAKTKQTEVVVGQSRKDEFELQINSNGTNHNSWF